MKYLPINKQPRREVNVPEISGGVNTRDSISNILDNQLTDCLNVWYKDGTLRTRPGFETNLKNVISCSDEESIEKMPGFKAFPEIINDGKVLASFSHKLKSAYQFVDFWWQGEDEIIKLPHCGPTTQSGEPLESAVTYFVAEKDGVLYCYFSHGQIFKLNYMTITENSTWVEIEEKDFYVPSVYIHCQRSGWDDFKGTQFEGYNLLSSSYKMIYSAYNESDSDASHPMRYALAQELPPEGGEIKVEITSYDSENEKTIMKEHFITYTEADYESFSKGTILIEKLEEGKTFEDGLCLFVKYNYVGFVPAIDTTGYIVKTLDSEDEIKKYACNEDNVVITAPTSVPESDLEKVFNMTQTTWFGGAANGLEDGSRLFLCGNTLEKEKSLVIWSGLNDPLYFPENCYAYVGNKAHPAKAFGKQDDKLVIFKPNDTFYTYYAQNTDITADDLINQNVVDYQANSVYFPMIQLNGKIGCDCPETVQLCRNRLVWANSNGKVYTLVSTNQYNEMSIYEVSEMVERKIREARYTQDQLINAQSCDFGGHYVLIIGQDAYVMDYNSYGYQYVHSYSKSEDANIKIPWYIWQLLPSSISSSATKITSGYCGFDEKIVAAHFINQPTSDTTAQGQICTCVLMANNDTTDKYISLNEIDNELIITSQPIASNFTTKLFDFSAPHYRKNVDRVSIAFGNNGGALINVGFITDVGTEDESVTLSGNEFMAYTPDHITVKHFNPCIRSVTRFGIQIQCEGQMSVDAINLLYRLLGGVR